MSTLLFSFSHLIAGYIPSISNFFTMDNVCFCFVFFFNKIKDTNAADFNLQPSIANKYKQMSS